MKLSRLQKTQQQLFSINDPLIKWAQKNCNKNSFYLKRIWEKKFFTKKFLTIFDNRIYFTDKNALSIYYHHNPINNCFKLPFYTLFLSGAKLFLQRKINKRRPLIVLWLSDSSRFAFSFKFHCEYSFCCRTFGNTIFLLSYESGINHKLLYISESVSMTAALDFLWFSGSL